LISVCRTTGEMESVFQPERLGIGPIPG
jgi:hypothetical protein